MKTQSEARRPTRREWDELRGQVEADLRDNAGLLGRFRDTLAGLFTGMAEGRTFGRRPNVSLRLIADGEPPAKVIALPGWNPGVKALNCRHLVCELLVERDVQTSQGPGKQRQRRAKLWLAADGRVGAGSLYWATAAADYGRVLATLRSFLDDRRAVLARSHDHCCVCGRRLTDGLSRARGIGPECVKFSGMLVFLGPARLVTPEPSPQDVGRVEPPAAEPKPVGVDAGRRLEQGLLFG
jgi:hypothetical protein